MEEFKGTPAPWTVAKYKTKVYHQPPQKWMPIQSICHVSEVPMDREERAANTFLIAASPDLLKSLSELLEQFKRVVEPKFTLDTILIREAETAINKALGK